MDQTGHCHTQYSSDALKDQKQGLEVRGQGLIVQRQRLEVRGQGLVNWFSRTWTFLEDNNTGLQWRMAYLLRKQTILHLLMHSGFMNWIYGLHLIHNRLFADNFWGLCDPLTKTRTCGPRTRTSGWRTRTFGTRTMTRTWGPRTRTCKLVLSILEDKDFWSEDQDLRSEDKDL